MSESYSEKLVRITITFDEGGENGSQMIFMQHAMNMRITKQGAPELPKTQSEI